jgi:hypothetical protein
MLVGASIRSPVTKTKEYAGVQEQVPVFWMRHVLVKSCPGSKSVPSMTVTSLTKLAASQRATGGGSLAVAAVDRVGNGLVGDSMGVELAATGPEACCVSAAAV